MDVSLNDSFLALSYFITSADWLKSLQKVRVLHVVKRGGENFFVRKSKYRYFYGNLSTCVDVIKSVKKSLFEDLNRKEF